MSSRLLAVVEPEQRSISKSQESSKNNRKIQNSTLFKIVPVVLLTKKKKNSKGRRISLSNLIFEKSINFASKMNSKSVFLIYNCQKFMLNS